MDDDQESTGVNPPTGTVPDPSADDDGEVEYVTEWNWPFILGGLAVVLLLGVVVTIMTLSGGDPAPTTTTSPTTTASTTTQLSAELTVADLLPLDRQFTTLLEVVGDGQVAELLADDGELTFFAPSSEALVDAAVPEGQDARDAWLRQHLVQGVLSTRDLADLDGATVTTLSGDELGVQIGEDRSITVGGATVTKRGIAASNGVIYVVDGPVSP
jgi:uncharacterized surface protein with fasciclin (FAS1) repeats